MSAITITRATWHTDEQTIKSIRMPVFVEEQKGEATLGHIIFLDGTLTVSKKNQNLQKIMRFDHCDAFALAIPKNASESIHAALAYTWPNGRQHRVHDHKLLKDVLLDGDDFTRTHYCIAIVREPVERFVSAWWYLQWKYRFPLYC